jgi:hypothetical protein
METHAQISPEEASAALAMARSSRARVAWAGYPAWYWLGTAAGLGVAAWMALQPRAWTIAAAVAIAVFLIAVNRIASRVRGVCEGHVRTAVTKRESLLLGGSPAVLMIAGAVASKSSPWVPIVTAVLVFTVYAATGLSLTARASRR